MNMKFWTEKKIAAETKRLARKYPGVEFRVVRIDGEFAGILPVDPATGEVCVCSVHDLREWSEESGAL